MEAALDAQVWAEVQRRATDSMYGPTDDFTRSALGGASSKTVRQAMEAALDAQVWAEVQRRATDSMYGPTDDFTRSALGGASSKTVRQAMEYLLSSGESQRTAQPPPQDSFNYRSGSRGTRNDYRYQEQTSSPGGSGQSHDQYFDDLYNDLFGNTWEDPFSNRSGNRGFKNDHRQRTQTGTNEPPKSSTSAQSEPNTPPESEKTRWAKGIADQIASQYHQYSWLKSEDPTNILKVLNTITKLREQAKAKGETISDRQIYLRFRRTVEPKGPEDSLQTSFRILDAFMGGSPNNKLPI